MKWRVTISLGSSGKILYQLEWVDPRLEPAEKKPTGDLEVYLAEHKDILFGHQYQLHLEPPLRHTPCLCLWVARLDVIEWVSDLPYAVHFHPISPVDKIFLQGRRGVPASGTVLESTPYGKYYCFVAVCKESTVYTDDPDIIVDPRRPKGTF